MSTSWIKLTYCGRFQPPQKSNNRIVDQLRNPSQDADVKSMLKISKLDLWPCDIDVPMMVWLFFVYYTDTHNI